MANVWTYQDHENDHGLDILKASTGEKIGELAFDRKNKSWRVSFPKVKSINRAFGDQYTAKVYIDGIQAAVSLIGSEIFG